jgi:hypothetical protein
LIDLFFLLFDIIKIHGAGGVPVGKKEKKHENELQE